MSELIIANLNNQIILCNSTQNVLKNIQMASVDFMHACGGKGRCTTCAMTVINGSENLTKPTTFEEKQHEINRLKPNERLACQCHINGNVIIEVPERLKLPHINYL